MNIGIITINGIKNIGNRLQNFAVQELLKERGHTVSTLLWNLSDENASKVSKAKTAIANLLAVSHVLTSKFYLQYIKKNPRMLLCKAFDDRYLSLTDKYFFKTKTMHKHHADFDLYCVGSDQIWNPILVQNRDFFFMQFAPSENTFSFSASMGTTSIPEQYREVYQKGFNHVGHISVREADMQDLIFEMTGRDSTLLLDPTLLLDKAKWTAIAEKPKTALPEKYVATYFLGEPTESQRRHIEQYAKTHHLGIVDINGTFADYIGPSEFVHIIANADFVFTDSFHGTAFSLIFEKRFLAFQRNHTYDMSSRIVTVLNTFRLPHRFYNVDNTSIDDSIYDLINTINVENQSHIPSVMADEKQKAQSFLDTVFKNN